MQIYVLITTFTKIKTPDVPMCAAWVNYFHGDLKEKKTSPSIFVQLKTLKGLSDRLLMKLFPLK